MYTIVEPDELGKKLAKLAEYEKICDSPEELAKLLEHYRTMIRELRDTVQILNVESMWR